MASPNHFKKEFYLKKKREIIDQAKANTAIDWANDHYNEDDTATRFKVAFYYLVAAEYLQGLDRPRASRLFHYAGHHFRKLEEWNRAGKAYMAAGDLAVQAALRLPSWKEKRDNLLWATRSYARAKNCFSDVGDADEAGQAYVKEQTARRHLAEHEWKAGRWLTLTFWWLTSN